MHPTKIDWPFDNLFTCNPVIGCERGCEYCYAKGINDRFKFVDDFSKPKFFENQLLGPLLRRKPTNVFIGSMSDICYWDTFWMKMVLSICRSADHHTYYFLTKDPSVYENYNFPSNCWLGMTLTGKENFSTSILHFFNNVFPRCNNTFLSLEPLLGEIPYNSLTSRFDKIICGAETGKGAKPPKKEWLQSVLKNIPDNILYIKKKTREMYL